MSIEFAKKFHVVGYDISNQRIKELKENIDTTFEVSSRLIKSVKQNINFVNDIEDAKKCDIYIITVPTPINKNNSPNLSPLLESTRAVGGILKKKDIVIYESTVYPGVTRDICVPVLEKFSGLIFNKDFFCGYSPERINPGDKKHTITKTIKITSGSTVKIAKQVDKLYKEIIVAGTYLAPSIEIAEAAKAIENTQRDVNIALINELAIIFDHLSIDTNEVIKAASTKWNFIKFLPGLVGGHCIGVDPYYLTYKAKEVGYKPNLILSARQVNDGMSKYIVNKTMKELIKSGIVVKDCKVLILGFTFKEDCSDVRNTKVINIIYELREFCSDIDVYDPWIKPNDKILDYKMISDPLRADKKYDAIIVAVSHKEFKRYTSKNFSKLSKKNNIIIDIKNIVEKPTWKL